MTSCSRPPEARAARAPQFKRAMREADDREETTMRKAWVNRRKFVKGGAALGAASVVSMIGAPAVRAARSIKIGYVSPQTGPLAAFAEADNFVISNFLEAVKAGVKVGSATYPVEVTVKDSQSNPN